MAKLRDIESQKFPQLDWTAGNIVASLKALRDYVITEANQAIRWYSERRVWKRWGARIFRIGAILCTGVGGLIPIFGKWFETEGIPGIDPVASAVFIGLAGISVALDRFLGCSSGWTRYMQTEQDIQTLLKSYRFEFSRAEVDWIAAEPDPAKIQAIVDRCTAMIVEVDEIVQKETNEWIAEFEGVVKQLDQSAKAAPAQKPPPAPPPAP